MIINSMKVKFSLLLAVCMLLVTVLVANSAYAQTTYSSGSNSGLNGSTNSSLNGTTNNSTGVNGTTGTGSTSATYMSTDATGANASSTQNSSSTPGVPNTGAGGNATMNLLLLAVTGIAAMFGLVYVGRTAYS
jgi:hypothetical protein